MYVSCSYQLIYACGAPEMLPARDERVNAVQTLLQLASKLAVRARSPDAAAAVRDMLPPRAAVLEAPGKPGAFCGLRLLPGEVLDGVMPLLHDHLAEELLQDPPHCFRWLRHVAADVKVGENG